MEGVDYNLDDDLVSSIGFLQAMNQKVLDYLHAIPELAVIKHMFSEDSKTLKQEIDKALTGTAPISVMVAIGECKDTAPGVPNQIRFDPMEIIIVVMEQPNLNRGRDGTGLTVNRAAELVACRMKGERIGDAFFTKADFRLPTEDLGSVAARLVVLTISATIE